MTKSNDLTRLSLADAKKGLQSKDFTVKELTQAHLDAMKEKKDLNAFVLETPELALEQAAASQKKYDAGTQGPLEGLPIANKDLYCTKGIRTTACSKILASFIPPYESTVSQNLLDAGVVTLGKLNMDEFAMGSANMNSYFGPVINPWTDKEGTKSYVPGGSSGGSAAAVSAHMALAATASDTGGSIRQPASFCGLVGIKPTYGLCSRYGMIAFASSLDQAGPLTRTVEDAAMMLEAMAGHDPKDATSLNIPKPQYTQNLGGSIKGKRVGLPKEYYLKEMHPDILKKWDEAKAWLLDAGAELVDVSLPHTSYALPAYYIIAPAEASSNLARYDGVRYGFRRDADSLDALYEQTRSEGFGDEVKRRILIGTYVLSAGYYDAYYRKAGRLRRLIAQDFEKVFHECDVLLSATTPTPAFAFGEKPKDPISMYMNDVLTVPANIAGLPGISVPVGLSETGLPLGLQLVGPALSEALLFDVSLVLEKASNFLSMAQEKGNKR